MPDSPKTITFGVIADTHIPDRVKKLPKGLKEELQAARVDHIFHAGDASSWKVVRELEIIAPVTIVQGNRDWLLGMHIPRHKTLIVNGVQITLSHGHRSMYHYIGDKWAHITSGYSFERYHQHLSRDYPLSNVIIFGHTHNQVVKWVNGQLFFNPGAAYPCVPNNFVPQFGILSITPSGVIRTACYSLL